jgi:hypothetical protein
LAGWLIAKTKTEFSQIDFQDDGSRSGILRTGIVCQFWEHSLSNGILVNERMTMQHKLCQNSLFDSVEDMIG